MDARQSPAEIKAIKSSRRTVQVGDKSVDVLIELLPLRESQPYIHKITASHGGHVCFHAIAYGTDKFSSGDAKSETERAIKQLAEKVATMSDVKQFLDEFHAADSV